MTSELVGESAQKNTEKPKRLHGLDILKLILAIMIVARHSGLISVVPAQGYESLSNPYAFAWYLYMNLQGLAVPVFMLISLWFFAKKREGNPAYFKKRIVRLLQVLGFWWVVYGLVATFTSYSLRFDSIFGYLGMPFFDGALYFLGGLILQVCAVELITRLLDRLPKNYELGTLVALFSLTALLTLFLASLLLDMSTPLTAGLNMSGRWFLAYAPAAMLLARRTKKEALLTLGIVGFSAYVIYWAYLFGVAEVFQPTTLENIFKTGYDRPQVLFFAAVVILLFIQIRQEPPPQAISKLSEITLGVYLIHPLLIPQLQRFLYSKLIYHSDSLGSVAVKPVFFGIVLICTLATAWVMSKTVLKNFVS